MNSGRWFYFIRDGRRMQLRTNRAVPTRPLDAQPDNGDPLTPWYEVQDHFDDVHVHVYAMSKEAAIKKAKILVESPSARGWRRSPHHPHKNPDPFDTMSVAGDTRLMSGVEHDS